MSDKPLPDLTQSKSKWSVVKAGDKNRSFIIPGAVVGVIAGCLLGYWFESPTLRAEYSWCEFYGNFFEVIRRSGYVIEEKYEIIDLSGTEQDTETEIDATDPETAIADEPETGDTVDGEVIKSEIKKKNVAAPLMPWLLSVVTFGLVGFFLGALIPNKRRPVKSASDEVETT